MEDSAARYQLSMEACTSELRNEKEAMKKLREENVLLQHQHLLQLQQIEMLKQEVTSLTNQVNESHALVQNLLNDTTASQESPTEARQQMLRTAPLPSVIAEDQPSAMQRSSVWSFLQVCT